MDKERSGSSRSDKYAGTNSGCSDDDEDHPTQGIHTMNDDLNVSSTREPRRSTRTKRANILSAAFGLGLLAVLSRWALVAMLSTPAFDEEVPLEAWGPLPLDDTDVRPFQIPTPLPKDVEDLRVQLNATRWLDQAPAFALESAHEKPPYGVSTSAAQDLAVAWASFDWDTSPTVAKLKSLDHFETSIGGLRMHFVRAAAQIHSSGRSPCGRHVVRLPLLLLHGWPGSVLEFTEAIPRLIVPQCLEVGGAGGVCFVFDVVAPSLPGYGWSDGAAKPIGSEGGELDVLGVGRIMLELMRRLGYGERFWIQGGDWGGIIAASMAQLAHADARKLGAASALVSAPLAAGKATTGKAGGKKGSRQRRTAQEAEDAAGAAPAVAGLHLNFVSPDLAPSLGVLRAGLVMLLRADCSSAKAALARRDCASAAALAAAHEASTADGGGRADSDDRSATGALDAALAPADATVGLAPGWRGALLRRIVPDAEDRERLCSSGLHEARVFAAALLDKTGYMHQQATRPDTLAAALHASPGALLAWHLDKFGEWTHRPPCASLSSCASQQRDAAALDGVGRDWLAANLATYWHHPGGAGGPLRLYRASLGSGRFWRALASAVPGPVALADFPGEPMRFPTFLLRGRFPGLARRARQPAGGHFAALEQPAVFAREVALGLATVALPKSMQ